MWLVNEENIKKPNPKKKSKFVGSLFIQLGSFYVQGMMVFKDCGK